jgi:cytochrome P450
MTGAGIADRLDTPELYARGEQHEVWRWLRENDPVHWRRGRDGRPGHWVVTRYRDVERVLSDYSGFTSERGTLLNLLGRPDPAAGRQLAATDPPKHDRMRAPLQRAMTVRPLDAYADRIRLGIRALIAPLGEGGPFDFAAAMGRLPLVALGVLLALPEQDHGRLIELANMATAEEDPEVQLPGGEQPTLSRAHRELFAYFTDLVRARVKQPGSDLVSLLASSPVDGTAPSIGSVVSNCYSMLLGSAGTLPHVATAAVEELARAGGYGRWAEQPELLDSGVEEALRWAAPASNFLRYAVRDTTLGSTRIAAGEAVVAYLASANRDAEVFADPDRFDVARRPNRHLAFGVGHHYCVGSQLARLTLRLLFQELFELCSDVRLIAEPDRFHSRFLAGFKRMPVVGTAR